MNIGGWWKGVAVLALSIASLSEAAFAAQYTQQEKANMQLAQEFYAALDAADAATDEGWSLEVVDLRSLSPLDTATVVASVERTGRAIVVHEASMTLGMGAEIAARIQEQAFYHLEAPVLRATGLDTPYPPAKLEEYWLPDVDRILDLVERSLSY
jgi:2-oxoisovalerate dehydrogenase E1 component beta subunit